MLRVLFFAAFATFSSFGASFRLSNGANCVGVSSCRPRCISFSIDRNATDCDTMTGAFVDTSYINPWDTKDFRTYNCESDGSCMNDQCGQSLPANLTVRIGEEGYRGSYYNTFVDLAAEEDSFTFCSIYPCPKDECTLPEQMVSNISIVSLVN